MSALTLTAEQTMSSREIADLIANGTASDLQALHFASRMVGALSSAVKRTSACCSPNISIEQATTCADDLSDLILLARNVSAGLTRYPSARDLLIGALDICDYAGAVVIPAAILGSRQNAIDEITKTYIVRNPASGLLKIGKSINVPARIKSLETGCGERLELLGVVDSDVEGKLHRQFADIRVFGEWFKDDGRIREFASSLKESI